VSYAFNGPVNMQAQGNPVPVAYGETWTGSAVISGGIFSEDQA
jgi:predicted phage tail protein